MSVRVREPARERARERERGKGRERERERERKERVRQNPKTVDTKPRNRKAHIVIALKGTLIKPESAFKEIRKCGLVHQGICATAVALGSRHDGDISHGNGSLGAHNSYCFRILTLLRLRRPNSANSNK